MDTKNRYIYRFFNLFLLSSPLRRRGLKYLLFLFLLTLIYVVSLAETWIEIICQICICSCKRVVSLAETWIEIICRSPQHISNISRLPCGDVDWNSLDAISFWRQPQGRLPCGDVDWNRTTSIYLLTTWSRLPCGDVDWNHFCTPPFV